MRVRPVRIHLPPDEFGTRTVRGVGFRAVSKSGDKGPTRRTYREARSDMRTVGSENAAPSVREVVSPTESAEA